MPVSGGAGVAPSNLVGFGVPVLTRQWYSSGGVSASSLSDGILTWGVAQRRHAVMRTCTDLRVVLAAITAYEDPVGAVTESNIVGTMTVSVAVWAQTTNPNESGTGTVVSWPAASVGLTDGQVAVSDIIPLGRPLIQGDVVWIRTLTTVPSGGKWPLAHTGAGLVAALDGETTGTGAAPSLLGTTVPPSNGPNVAFHPTVALGVLL